MNRYLSIHTSPFTPLSSHLSLHTSLFTPQADRIEVLSKRAMKWANLSRKRNADKKVAVTVFSFPPDKGNVGTAAYLNVFGSILECLKTMQRAGCE